MDYQIKQEPDGTRTALDPTQAVPMVAVRPDGPSRIFHRRAHKYLGDGTTEDVAWLVAELNGVRAYLDGGVLILTTQDLYP